MYKKKAGRNSTPWRSWTLPARPQWQAQNHRIAILADLDKWGCAALQVPIEELVDSKENIRSAPESCHRKQKRNVATASDGQFITFGMWPNSVVEPVVGGSKRANDQAMFSRISLLPPKSSA